MKHLEKLQEDFNNGEISLDAYTESVVHLCMELCEIHGESMASYNFNDKAKTAFTCAGIIREHFDVKELECTTERSQ